MTLFCTASAFSTRRFGGRVQKIPVDGGFSCPNRDGTLSATGCIYCNNNSFSPFYVSPGASISEQLQSGRDFFTGRYQCSRFFAYFQTFSGTHAPIEILKSRYHEALQFPGIEGLIIATRPDCLDVEVIDLLAELARHTYIRVELGVESFDDQVLKTINRCHDAAASLEALKRLRAAGIDTCIHLIFGLPGEHPDNPEQSARAVSDSGAILVKLHHLQIIAGTSLADQLSHGQADFKLHTLETYLSEVVRFVSCLSSQVYIERFINRVPAEFLVAPRWGNITESGFQKLLEQQLSLQNLSQGAKYGNTC